MLIGGGAADAAAHATAEAINNVNVIDLAANQPQYRDTAPLQYARMHPTPFFCRTAPCSCWRQPDGRIARRGHPRHRDL